MNKQNIFKTFGLIALPIFAAGILFLSVRADQVEAKDLIKNGRQMMGRIMNSHVSFENHNRLTLEQKKEMIDQMKKHHGENWQNHHQQMHGSDSGT